jgi:hypothetical protein
MPNAPRTLLIAGVYPLLLAVLTGAAWLDGVYARALHATFREAALHGLFSTVSDALLLLVGLALLAGVAASIFSSGRARVLCVVSLGVLTLELVLPALVSAVPGAAAWLDGNGMLLRLAVLLGALACAVFAVREAVR